MKKQLVALLMSLPVICTAQIYWNESGNNMTSGKLGIGTSPSSSYDIDILRNDWIAGLKIVNSNWGGRALILFGQQGSNSKYGYIAHHSQSHDAGAGYTQTYKASSTVLVGSDANGLGIISANDIRFTAGGGDDSNQRMVLRGDGNLGIGTPIPSSRLHVVGSIFSNSTRTNTVFSGSPLTDNANLIGSEGYWALRTAINNSYNLDVYNSGSVRVAMTILQDGNVGIGTTTPDHKLTVDGTVKCEEVRVEVFTGTGPDYVFEKDYNLTPLSELEKYITQNKHLPEVPSAKEMEANGLNLKEMNLLLLKKVEELTLHLIEKDKEVQHLQRRNTTIEERLQKIENQ